jgi:hypothetical protein
MPNLTSTFPNLRSRVVTGTNKHFLLTYDDFWDWRFTCLHRLIVKYPALGSHYQSPPCKLLRGKKT